MNDTIRFSQNFLRDPKFVATLLSKTNIKPEDTVYDIGGGKGIIAAALAKNCRTVITIEIDPRLVRSLRKNLSGYGNILVYEADFLSLPLPQTRYKVFSNIPFNLSADILHKLTDTPHPPTTSYLIVQKEFANKLIPKPGGYNSQLSILLGAQFEVKIVQSLQPINFYPRHRVYAVLLEISPRTEHLVTRKDWALYKDFITYNYNACQPSIAVGCRAYSRQRSSRQYHKFCDSRWTLRPLN